MTNLCKCGKPADNENFWGFLCDTCAIRKQSELLEYYLVEAAKIAKTCNADLAVRGAIARTVWLLHDRSGNG
jgi:hypothetical protein